MNEVYPREPTRHPFNLTEEQVLEAQRDYDTKIKGQILSELQAEFPLLDFEADESVLDLLLRTIDKALLAGMEMIAERHQILHDYKERKKAEKTYKLNVLDYEFKEGMGVCGTLLPSGEFLKCGNAEHYIIADSLDFAIQTRCVYFTSVFDGKWGSVSLSPIGGHWINEAQAAWVEAHKQYMDTYQYEMYKIHKGEDT